MEDKTNLIVMLTHNDRTVTNASAIFNECKNSDAEFWGIKEEGLPIEDMKKLYSVMKKCGKTTFLEVVAYNEEECIKGAQMAKICGCDVLMGTLFFDSVNKICKENNIRYMPFVGKVSGRPSVLEGEIEEIILEAKQYLEKGVFGIDLLGYRYMGNKNKLIKRFVESIDAPVCVAGSIGSFEKLDFIKEIKPWAYTIGGAFFENKFSGDFEMQINSVCHYMKMGEKNV